MILKEYLDQNYPNWFTKSKQTTKLLEKLLKNEFISICQSNYAPWKLLIDVQGYNTYLVLITKNNRLYS